MATNHDRGPSGDRPAPPALEHDAATAPVPDLLAEAPGEDHGRIGYGRYARFTPLALAALLVVGLAAIGLAQRDLDARPPVPIVDGPAPDVTLTRLDGTPLRLADLRGSVVVLNFWASWCVPCRDEMPLFQQYSEAAARTGEATVVVGVGVRTDHDADARTLVERLGLTYPIGRDTMTEEPGVGPIERAFGVPSAYPSTVFIRPDGAVDRLHLGPLTAEQLRFAVAEAGEA